MFGFILDSLAWIGQLIAFIFSWIWKNTNRVLAIIIKNVKVLIRSKSSALVVIFGPLLIVSLIGLAFNNSTIYDIKIGVYSDKYSELSDNIVKQLEDEQYSVKKVDTRDLCINGIKRGDYNICLILSPEMAVDGKKPNKITFYVDYTRVNLVYAIMDNIAKKLTTTTNKLSLEMTQNLINRLEDTKTELAKRISSVSSLSANNVNVAGKIDSVRSGLIGVNLTYVEGDLKLDEVLNYMNTARKVADAKNYTLPEIVMAIAKAEDAQKKLNWIGYQMRTAREDIDKRTGDLLISSQILSSDKKSLDELRDSVMKITSGIQAINVTTAASIVAPIQTDIQPVVTEKTYLGRLFPTFLVLVLMFVCIMLAVTLVLSEKETNAYFRNFITPARDFVFILGTYLTCLLIVAVQLVIILYVIRFFLEPSMVESLTNSYLPILLITTMFIFIGMAIGYLFSSQETAILAALFVISGSLFFSNTVLPLETISSYVKWIVALNPFVLGEAILKKVLIFGFKLNEVTDLIWNLLKFIGFAIIVVYVALKYYKKTLNN